MADIVSMPRLSLNDETNFLSSWYVKEGDSVVKGDKLFSIETDKSTMDVYAESDGVILKRFYEDDAVVPVLSPVCVIGMEGEEIPDIEQQVDSGANEEAETVSAKEAPISNHAEAETKQMPENLGKVFLTPRARRVAEMNGITDFSSIIPSGAENRIMEEDILAYMNGDRFAAKAPESAGKKTYKVPKIRKVIAENMMSSLNTTAQLTMFRPFDATSLKQCRDNYKKAAGETKNITIGDMVFYVIAKTLADFPYMNASFDGEEVTEYADVNLGCAVDTERGLMVPTIMNAEKKSILEISGEIKTYAEECRQGSIHPDKLKNGTFTVSNLGSFGITAFTPILNPPQVGIIGVGAFEYKNKRVGENMICYPSCTLSLTFDHRLVDGGPAARFLKSVCENLERVDELLAEGE